MYSSFYRAIMGTSGNVFAFLLKAQFLIIIAYAIGIMFYILLNSNEDYTVSVKPTNEAARQTLAQYNNSKITATGTMIAPDPGITVKLLWNPNSRYLANFIECLFIIYISLQAFFIFRDAARPEISREKIAIYLGRIGFAFWALILVNLIRSMLVKSQVLSFSNNEFRLDEDFTSPGLIWLGVLFLALSLAIKDIAGLKKEQELTI